jgi:hypothetical protein
MCWEDRLGGGEGKRRLLDRSKLFTAVRSYVDSHAPGYFNVLDVLCRKLFSRSCVDLLIEEPEKLREILMNKHSNDVHPVYFVVKYLFLRPILIELDRLDAEEELATLFMQNPGKFREKLKQVLNP